MSRPPPVSRTATVLVNIKMDADGKWIAFGRSDNSAEENRAVNLLLGAAFLGPQSEEFGLTLTVPVPVPELADVG